MQRATDESGNDHMPIGHLKVLAVVNPDTQSIADSPLPNPKSEAFTANSMNAQRRQDLLAEGLSNQCRSRQPLCVRQCGSGCLCSSRNGNDTRPVAMMMRGGDSIPELQCMRR